MGEPFSFIHNQFANNALIGIKHEAIKEHFIYQGEQR
jgi:hypothetical protein